MCRPLAAHRNSLIGLTHPPPSATIAALLNDPECLTVLIKQPFLLFLSAVLGCTIAMASNAETALAMNSPELSAQNAPATSLTTAAPPAVATQAVATQAVATQAAATQAAAAPAEPEIQAPAPIREAMIVAPESPA